MLVLHRQSARPGISLLQNIQVLLIVYAAQTLTNSLQAPKQQRCQHAWHGQDWLYVANDKQQQPTKQA